MHDSTEDKKDRTIKHVCTQVHGTRKTRMLKHVALVLYISIIRNVQPAQARPLN